MALKSPFGEVVNKRMFVCMYVCIKPLDNFHPDGLVFKTMWGSFNILIGCFATCLSNLLLKILPILLTLQVIVEIHFSSFFWVGILGVFEPNFKSIGKVYIPYLFVQRRHICVKTKEVFLLPNFSQQFTSLGDYLSRCVNTLKSLKYLCQYN